MLGAIFVAPAILYVLLLVGVPFLLAVYYSVSAYTIYDPSWRFVGLANFEQIVQDPVFRQTLSNTFIFTFGSQILGLILGKFGALVLLRPFPGRKFVRALIILPWAVPIALATVAWEWMFDSLYSVINWTLIALGFITRSQAPNWLGNPDLAMLSVIVVNAWRFFPFAIVIFLAGITAIPQDVLDAATVDGAGFWRRNYQIILPMILPIVAVGLIFGIVFTFTDLSIVFLLTMGGPVGATSVLGFHGFPDRHRLRRRIPWRRHLAVHAAGAVHRGHLHAALYSAAGDLTMQRAVAKTLQETSFYGAVAFFVILAAFPFYWMVITAFKTNADLYNVTNIPFWFNDPPTLEHFRYLFEKTLFATWLLNSLIIGICVVAITLVTALPAAYSLARMTGRNGEALGIGIFLTYLVPPTLLFLPLSRVVADLGLQNSMWALVLVYPTFTIPFCTWLLMGFFKALPPEIEEAAIVDGCSLFGAFVKIALPLSLPGILTVVIFTFTLTLQEFVYALTFISSSSQKPITLGVATDLIRGDIFYWGEIMAGALLASIPVAIAYNFFLDRFIAGITGGAVK